MKKENIIVYDGEIEDAEYDAIENIISYVYKGHSFTLDCTKLEKNLPDLGIGATKLDYWQEYNPTAYVIAVLNNTIVEECIMATKSIINMNDTVRKQMEASGTDEQTIRNVLSDLCRERFS